ncbi:MAG: helix-turn-helix domain-containing protein [Betaproteobacteria bacterium]
MTAEREAFGPRLRRQRESRGIDLQTIASSTKISRSLLAALERGDVSRWPLGIYRRSFVRAYAAAIGLDPDAEVAEFLRLFPEPGAAPPADPPPAADQASLRLTLAPERRSWTAAAPLRRALAAAVDAAGVLLAAAVAAWLANVSVWSAAGVIAVVYYTATQAVVGKTVAAVWLGAPAPAPPGPAAVDERSWHPRREPSSPRRNRARQWGARAALTHTKF